MISKDNDGYLMGIDLGTSTLKVAIFNLYGKEISYKSMEYPLSYTGKGFIENNLKKYWRAIVKLIKIALLEINDPQKIIALSLSSQAETIVPIDKNGEPLRNAIVWQDCRSSKEAKDISKVFNQDKMFRVTGQPSVDSSWPATRIKWFKKNQPEIFSKTYKFLLLEDYIAFKITGKMFGEKTVYSTSYYYDIKKFEYYNPMLDYLGVKKDKFPEILTTGTIIGNISKKAARETGLSIDTKFVVGALDQLAGAIGAGNIKEGMATETTGTVFAMVVTTNNPRINIKSRIPCCVHAVGGKYCLLPYSMTGGMMLKWFKDNFYLREEESVGDSIYNLMIKEADTVAPGCQGLITLPHLTGAYTPENNPDARGVFYGISINHTRAYFVRSILESVGFMMRKDLELFSRMGIKIEKIFSMGGGAKSNLWNQIKSDITGIKINIPSYTETAVLGAAIIAGVGAGIYKDYDDATKNIVKIKERFFSNRTNKKTYDKTFSKYTNLYERVEILF